MNGIAGLRALPRYRMRGQIAHNQWPPQAEVTAHVDHWGEWIKAEDLDAVLAQDVAAPSPDQHCPHCGAPILKPGEQHAKVLPLRDRPPLVYFDADEPEVKDDRG